MGIEPRQLLMAVHHIERLADVKHYHGGQADTSFTNVRFLVLERDTLDRLD
jgi:hypothetical protein